MTKTERIPVAVIGVGHLGSRHARIYAGLPQAELVAVADTNPERVRAVADQYGTEAVCDYRVLLPRVKAASVAVPTESHARVACELLEAGIDVLVEKPIASTLDEARRMIDAARERARTLAVGHTERHNPAVAALMGERGDPRFIEVHRLGVFAPRSLDIDAVLDLMIHDLDVVASLVGTEVASVEAVGVPVLTERVDIANARIRFASGCVANLTASRISQKKVRKLRVWERERYVSIDYLSQEALCYRLVRNAGREPRIVCESLPVRNEEPLKREIEDFLAAVTEGRRPLVSGEDGLRALALAAEVVCSMAEPSSGSL